MQGYDVGRIRPQTKYAERFAEQADGDGVRISRLQTSSGLRSNGPTIAFRDNIEIKTRPDRPNDMAPPVVVADNWSSS